MYVLGLSCFFHDSSAALLRDGVIVAASEEERFSRKKHDQAFPMQSIEFCLSFAGITLDQVDAVVFYDKPLLKFDRLLETYFSRAPFGLKSFLKAMPIWLKEKIYFKKLIRDSLKKISKITPSLYFSEHHLSHAASAFYASPYDEAAVLCIDGVGEWATTSGWIGKGSDLKPLFEIHFPHSLGLFYSAFTGYLGFQVNSGEYKMMGLAPYGKPIYIDLIINNLIHFNNDGSFQLNLDYFDFTKDSEMITDKFIELFKNPRRSNEDIAEFTQFHKDLAASVQAVTEIAVLKLARQIKLLTGLDNLTMAGGVALNCVANGKLKESGIFKNIWIQPASGDSGGALGAALAYYFLEKKSSRVIDPNFQQGSLLGPSFKSEHIKLLLDHAGVVYHETISEEVLNELISEEIIKGSVIGLFQGRMEFGPRALGSRSIIGDPRFSNMQSIMNLKIKKRESFRPFAPAILKEFVSDYFYWEKSTASPYMLFTTQVKNTLPLPAITHVDGSARLQVVDENIHPRFHRLIKTFYKKSGCPVIINTSFNVRGEPIVARPLEAINCFMTTEMDVLVLENFLLKKTEQKSELFNIDWVSAYARD
ncbi:MAG: carbamoyltransferase [Bacteriovorax sp.]|nr:carbamoyltransferase [Bacteriovorax sp.]